MMNMETLDEIIEQGLKRYWKIPAYLKPTKISVQKTLELSNAKFIPVLETINSLIASGTGKEQLTTIMEKAIVPQLNKTIVTDFSEAKIFCANLFNQVMSHYALNDEDVDTVNAVGHYIRKKIDEAYEKQISKAYIDKDNKVSHEQILAYANVAAGQLKRKFDRKAHTILSSTNLEGSAKREKLITTAIGMAVEQVYETDLVQKGAIEEFLNKVAELLLIN